VELLIRFIPGLITVLMLYLLNKRFRYKEKLVSIMGIVAYKLVLFTLMFITILVLPNKFGVFMSRDPIGVSLMWAYIYLVAVSKS